MDIKEIIEKYLNGKASPEETARLVEWVMNDKALSDWWKSQICDASPSMTEVQKKRIYAKIDEYIEASEQQKQPWHLIRPISVRKMVQWVAILFLPVLSALVAYRFASSPDAHLCTVQSSFGNHSTVMLPDSSRVVLNSLSSLSYGNDYGRRVRIVQLNGEALFDVAHNADKPFIVRTHALSVRVLGTEFNVAAYSNADVVSVVLLRGLVSVSVNAEQHTLRPNQKLDYNVHTHQVTLRNVYVKDYIQWVNGNMYFESASFNDILGTIGRTNNMNIVIGSSDTIRQNYTGTIPVNDVKGSLNLLRLTTPFTYEMVGRNIVIHRGR